LELRHEQSPAQYQIKSYTATSITVNEQTFTHPILIMPNYLAPWPIHHIHALTTDSLLELAKLAPSVILLGTGPTIAMPAPAICAALGPLGIGLEIMSTPAACRTYTVLASEGRKVLAALLIETES
jgi:uncharacterized protein